MRMLEGSAKDKFLLYAPTAAGARLSRIKKDAGIIISTLLKSFPDYTVVFRPYPTSYGIEGVLALVSRFVGHKRFVIDTSVTGVAFQKLASVNITDSSSGAITFAMATCRPLVFTNLENDEANPVRNPFGYFARGRMALIRAVRHALQQAESWEHHIYQQRSLALYNAGSASRILTEALPVFAARETTPEWLSVERRPWSGAGAAEREQHIASLQEWNDHSPSVVTMKKEITEYLTPGVQAL